MPLYTSSVVMTEPPRRTASSAASFKMFASSAPAPHRLVTALYGHQPNGPLGPHVWRCKVLRVPLNMQAVDAAAEHCMPQATRMPTVGHFRKKDLVHLTMHRQPGPCYTQNTKLPECARLWQEDTHNRPY